MVYFLNTLGFLITVTLGDPHLYSIYTNLVIKSILHGN
jgi:hypothetical protein